MKAVKTFLSVGAVLMLAGFALAQTWTQASAPNKNWQAVASSADGRNLIAGGQSWTYCISTNSGSTWTTNTEPQIGSAYGSWSAIASSADGTKFVGINSSVIWVSTNSGLTWLANNVPGVSFFASVALSADGNKLVVVDGKQSSPGLIYTSTNSGITLTPTMAPANYWASVASSADGTKLVSATLNSQGGLIYASTNSGLTWTLTGAPTNNGWETVASSADGDILVAAPVGDQSFNPAPIYTSQTTPSPQLNLTPSLTNLTLAWTVPSTNFVLQHSADLISWADVTNPPVLNLANLQNQVMLSPTNRSGFYRLKSP